MTQNNAEDYIDASPTKNFFISMLIKDIGLIDAILDLVDNSVDGARRTRAQTNYNGISIRITASENQFRIADNAGGIPIDIAKKYAFRFGRPEDMIPTPGSVGQFGVGMKRALFKLGKEFRIESKTVNSRFVVQVDVDKWKEEKDWSFQFAEIEENMPEIAEEDRGTIITVGNLHTSVRSDFDSDIFQTRLSKELSDAHINSVNNGMAITLNVIPIQVRELLIKMSDDLRPLYRQITLDNPQVDNPPVNVKLYSGLADSDPQSAGWYIFCNGRLILGAEQTLVTGWGENNGKTIPKYHNQFAQFRGYVFFDSDDSGALPWNTTKTGVDADSSIYRAIRSEMIKATRPVIDFLNKLDAEKKSAEEAQEGPLNQAVATAQLYKISDVMPSPRFTAPAPVYVSPKQTEGKISYSRPLEDIKKAKSLLGVNTYREVGERTFDYFLEMEGDD